MTAIIEEAEREARVEWNTVACDAALKWAKHMREVKILMGLGFLKLAVEIAVLIRDVVRAMKREGVIRELEDGSWQIHGDFMENKVTVVRTVEWTRALPLQTVDNRPTNQRSFPLKFNSSPYEVTITDTVFTVGAKAEATQTVQRFNVCSRKYNTYVKNLTGMALDTQVSLQAHINNSEINSGFEGETTVAAIREVYQTKWMHTQSLRRLHSGEENKTFP